MVSASLSAQNISSGASAEFGIGLMRWKFVYIFFDVILSYFTSLNMDNSNMDNSNMDISSINRILGYENKMDISLVNRMKGYENKFVVDGNSFYILRLDGNRFSQLTKNLLHVRIFSNKLNVVKSS